MAENNDNIVEQSQPKCVVFDAENNVQLAEEGRTILVFVMGEEGVKVGLTGFVTETLLTTLKNNMPNIMDNVIDDFKRQASKQAKSDTENK